MSEPIRSQFIVQTAAACMPSSCWGRYRRVAVLEVQPGIETVSMISGRARGVIRIVKTWEKCNVGTTRRCMYEQAVQAAYDLAFELNLRAERNRKRRERAALLRVAALFDATK